MMISRSFIASVITTRTEILLKLFCENFLTMSLRAEKLPRGWYFCEKFEPFFFFFLIYLLRFNKDTRARNIAREPCLN